ncbi:hypothetical protein D3C87_1470480 [compost metagenome]
MSASAPSDDRVTSQPNCSSWCCRVAWLIGLSSATRIDRPSGAKAAISGPGITGCSPRTAASMPAAMCSTLGMTFTVCEEGGLPAALAST